MYIINPMELSLQFPYLYCDPQSPPKSQHVLIYLGFTETKCNCIISKNDSVRGKDSDEIAKGKESNGPNEKTAKKYAIYTDTVSAASTHPDIGSNVCCHLPFNLDRDLGV